MIQHLHAIVLMGPFGCGKTHLGHCLSNRGIANYLELEPTVYQRFGHGADFDVVEATAYIRAEYFRQLATSTKTVAFESTG